MDILLGHRERALACTLTAMLALAGCSGDRDGGEGDGPQGVGAGARDGGGGFGNADAAADKVGSGEGDTLDCIPHADMPDEFGRPPCPVADGGITDGPGGDLEPGPDGQQPAPMDGGARDGGDADGDDPPACSADDDAGCTDEPRSRCVLGGRCRAITGESAGALDLLFMVDNSGSMREEHVLLQEQFPNLMRVLTSGDRDGDGIQDFVPAQDLHLGVVSSDMGLVGIQGIPGCEGLGDDGILNNLPDPTNASCLATYPRFLTYTAGVDTPDAVADDFACVAALGTEGCGFEQQLEAALKAVTPSTSVIRFLGDVNGAGQLGHGDQTNAGFIRNGIEGRSVVAVIMVTDEEDCSSFNTRHFTPDIYLDPTDPLTMQDLNLRCFFNPQNLYPVTRYIEGLRALRPDAEELVIFGAIAGIPPDLVDAAALAAVDFQDAVARDAFYDGILADPRMQEVPDPNRTPEQGGNLTPSCITDTGRAFPPRRFVQVARAFGNNSVVQSICQSDFTPVMDAIVDRISSTLGSSCLAESLTRDAGLVSCEVVFELAPAGTPGTSVHACADLPYLSTPTDRPPMTLAGREVCIVEQVPVTDPGSGLEAEPGRAGWYYDDFTTEANSQCGATVGPRRVAFSAGAAIPDGTSAYLDCAP